VAGAARFFGETFAPLVIFYAFEHLYGLVAAIVSGIVSGALLVALQIRRERKVSAFTVFVAASVVVFGALDLRYRTGFFVKLEPALGNALTGAFFLGSVLWGAPLIVEFAERSAGRKLDRVRGYLTVWTVVWGLFFFARSGAYVWMAYHVALDRALLLRGVLGPLSFGALFVAEFAVRFLVYGRRAFGKLPEEPAADGSDPSRREAEPVAPSAGE
jgi:intracellular septation protein A